MESMTRSLCLPAAGRARLTLPAIGLVFALGSTTTLAGLSPPQPLMISVRLASRETPDFLISYPSHLFAITTSHSLRSRLLTDQSSKAFQPQSQSATVVSNSMGLGSTSCAHSITSTMPTTAYSLPYVLRTPESLACSRLLPPRLSQKN